MQCGAGAGTRICGAVRVPARPNVAGAVRVASCKCGAGAVRVAFLYCGVSAGKDEVMRVECGLDLVSHSIFSLLFLFYMLNI